MMHDPYRWWYISAHERSRPNVPDLYWLQGALGRMLDTSPRPQGATSKCIPVSIPLTSLQTSVSALECHQ